MKETKKQLYARIAKLEKQIAAFVIETQRNALLVQKRLIQLEKERDEALEIARREDSIRHSWSR